jgi:hypothetical protein
MKKLLIILIFILIGKFSIAENCKVEFNFLLKNKTWKPTTSSIVNGIIYIDVESENDSLIIQLNKEINCNNTLSNVYLDETKVPVSPKGNEIKTTSNGGLYKIEIIGPGSSEWFKIFVRVTKPTAVKNANLLTAIQIYPNPATANFFVENAAQVELIKIYDITGAVVLVIDNTFKKDVLDIDIAKLPAGQYFIAFQNDKTKITKKLVKL